MVLSLDHRGGNIRGLAQAGAAIETNLTLTRARIDFLDGSPPLSRSAKRVHLSSQAPMANSHKES